MSERYCDFILIMPGKNRIGIAWQDRISIAQQTRISIARRCLPKAGTSTSWSKKNWPRKKVTKLTRREFRVVRVVRVLRVVHQRRIERLCHVGFPFWMSQPHGCAVIDHLSDMRKFMKIYENVKMGAQRGKRVQTKHFTYCGHSEIKSRRNSKWSYCIRGLRYCKGFPLGCATAATH